MLLSKTSVHKKRRKKKKKTDLQATQIQEIFRNQTGKIIDKRIWGFTTGLVLIELNKSKHIYFFFLLVLYLQNTMHLRSYHINFNWNKADIFLLKRFWFVFKFLMVLLKRKCFDGSKERGKVCTQKWMIHFTNNKILHL